MNDDVKIRVSCIRSPSLSEAVTRKSPSRDKSSSRFGKSTQTKEQFAELCELPAVGRPTVNDMTTIRRHTFQYPLTAVETTRAAAHRQRPEAHSVQPVLQFLTLGGSEGSLQFSGAPPRGVTPCPIIRLADETPTVLFGSNSDQKRFLKSRQEEEAVNVCNVRGGWVQRTSPMPRRNF